MSPELILIRIERFRSYISLIAVILSIISLNKSEELELKRAEAESRNHSGMGNNASSMSPDNSNSSSKNKSTTSSLSGSVPTPSQISALAGWLFVISSILGVQVATTRVNQVRKEAEQGKDGVHLETVQLLTLGTYIGFISIVLSAIGAQRRVEEDRETVIITPL